MARVCYSVRGIPHEMKKRFLILIKNTLIDLIIRTKLLFTDNFILWDVWNRKKIIAESTQQKQLGKKKPNPN